MPITIRWVRSSSLGGFKLHRWRQLESLLEEKPLPKVVDAGTGDKIDLTTDRYRVMN